MDRFTIVNDKDEIIGAKDRDAIGPSDIYRVAALWVTDTRGNILLAQRAFSKKKDPGAWGPAVAGTVEEGEEYETNILKETREEIDITLTSDSLQKDQKIRITTPLNDYFSQWYRAVIDLPIDKFSIQKSEVEQVKWFTPQEVRELVKLHPEQCTPSASRWEGMFFNLV